MPEGDQISGMLEAGGQFLANQFTLSQPWGGVGHIMLTPLVRASPDF